MSSVQLTLKSGLTYHFRHPHKDMWLGILGKAVNCCATRITSMVNDELSGQIKRMIITRPGVLSMLRELDKGELDKPDFF